MIVNKDTPISILIENGIDLNSIGGQWLLICLEEKQVNDNLKFSPLNFYRSLNKNKEEISCNDPGYKAMMTAMQYQLKISVGKEVSPAKFINKYFNF